MEREGFGRREMEDPKRAAAEKAVEVYVRSGMVLGLGTGSTSVWAVRKVGKLLSSGDLEGVRGIPTSEETAALAREVGIPLADLSEALPDVDIDGADEIGPGLALIKGRGGALLREKIVASAAGGIVVVAEGSKSVEELGRGPLPVEVEPFGWEATRYALSSLGCETELRTEDGEQPFVTDGGHYTIDCSFGSIPDPEALEAEIKCIPGALENGLFVGLTRATVVAGEDGEVEVAES
jgi:ribose 5-phosphate isomerase A